MEDPQQMFKQEIYFLTTITGDLSLHLKIAFYTHLESELYNYLRIGFVSLNSFD